MILFKTDHWRIETNTAMGLHIIHTCPTGCLISYRCWWDYNDFKQECPECRKFIPDHLQAIYVFLTGDMETR